MPLNVYVEEKSAIIDVSNVILSRVKKIIISN